MVVIKEGFPSQREFITNYLDRKRQQLEILERRNFRTSAVPQKDEVIIPTPLDLYRTSTDEGSIEKSVKAGELETPQIIQISDEPRYVKNFNEFIRKTHLHLDELLFNSRKIDDVHDKMAEMQQPSLETDRLVSGADSSPTLSSAPNVSEDEFEVDYSGKTPNAGSSDFEKDDTPIVKKTKKFSKVKGVQSSKGAIPKSGRSLRWESDLKNDVKVYPNRETAVKSRSAREVLATPLKTNSFEPSMKMVSTPTRKAVTAAISGRERAGLSSSRSLNSTRPLGCETPKTAISSRNRPRFIKRTPPLPAKESICNEIIPPIIRGKAQCQIPVSIINL